MSETVATTQVKGQTLYLQSRRGAAVASVGTALPARSEDNHAIAARVGVTDDWIQSRTGVRERRVASGIDEGVTALASTAAREALGQAGVDAADIDLVIV